MPKIFVQFILCSAKLKTNRIVYYYIVFISLNLFAAVEFGFAFAFVSFN